MDFNQFTHQYSLSKTLRFELKPIGRTLENIKKKGLVNEDEERARKYKQAKKIADAFHKLWLQRSLESGEIPQDLLSDYFELYKSKKSKTDGLDKQEENLLKKLRTKVADIIKPKDEFIELWNVGNLFKSLLENWQTQFEAFLATNPETKDIEDPKSVMEYFKGWGTYFTGFNENRKNIYTADDKATSVANRLISENLPKYFENCIKYENLKKSNIDFSGVAQSLHGYTEPHMIDDFFVPENFNLCLSQKGIDLYNLVLGGVSTQSEKVQGVNEIINLYGQQNPEHKKLAKQSKMQPLFKQILSDRESASFRLEAYDNNAQILDDLAKIKISADAFYLPYNEVDQDTGELVQKSENVLEKIQHLFEHWDEYDLKGVFIANGKTLTNLYQSYYGDWRIIRSALELKAENILPQKGKKLTEKLQTEREKFVEKTHAFSLGELATLTADYAKNLDAEQRNKILSKSITESLSYQGFYEMYMQLKTAYDDFNSIKPAVDLDEKNIKPEHIEVLKNYLDALMTVYSYIKQLYVNPKHLESLEKDDAFYNQFFEIYERLDQIIPLYNKIRNYTTKKPYSIEKFKLNFQNQSLANGWDVNKEPDNTTVLLVKDNQYFLAVMDKSNNKIFKNAPKCRENAINKVNYKYLAGPNKMLPKVFFSAKSIGYYAPNEDILRIRNTASHTEGGTPQKGYQKEPFNLNDCHKMIAFYQQSIEKHPEWNIFGFTFRKPTEYQSIVEFYTDVANQGYRIEMTEIDYGYIESLVDKGQLYLFQIYSKDFSPHSKGTPNLHTLYWKQLFSSENLNDVVIKLNGEAELFYRPKSITYSEHIWENGHHANDPAKKQSYPIIKDKRFAQDKFQFHVPITINYKATGGSNINQLVNKHIAQQSGVNILGIDRGERHLAYYSLINPQGEILEQGTLNTIVSGDKTSDYHAKLDQVEKNRDQARKAWGEIENIKNLKEGYLSQVVHKICQLIVKHNAVVVFEDLNMGFKRGRFKIEKQVYQKFEKMLIEKLNYLVFKGNEATQMGGVLRGYQLSSKFESFTKLGRQSGIIYYVPAYHTSKICPLTGFVNLLYPKYESIEKTKAFIERLSGIRYNVDKRYFEIKIDYDQLGITASGSKRKWTICTYGERIKQERKNGYWESQLFDLSQSLCGLMHEFGVDYIAGNDLKEQLLKVDSAQLFKSFMWHLKMTLQMRNSDAMNDYLISPVADQHGVFFDSRNVTDHKLPLDADANGAYHIALKGKLMLEAINPDDGKLQANVKNEAWYQFVQNRHE